MRIFLILLVIVIVVSGCASPATLTAAPPSTTQTVPTGSPPPSPSIPLSPTAVSAPAATPTSSAPSQTPQLPEEAILILSPGPGSRLTSPILVSGMADSTFEQALVARLVADDGTILATVPTTIQSELGSRGPFEVSVPFNISGERQGFLQVFASSPRDGGVTHVASVGVILLASGTASVVTVPPRVEQIVIFQPTVGAAISGGIVHVEGFGLASFEQTLVIEVQDVNGKTVGSQAVTLNAPDLGLPGPFSADVAYSGAASGPGRVVVRDISPAFGGDTHLVSVEITLNP